MAVSLDIKLCFYLFLRGLLRERIRRDRRQTVVDLTGEILSHWKYWQRYCEPNSIRLPSAHEQFVEVDGEHILPLNHFYCPTNALNYTNLEVKIYFDVCVSVHHI